MADLYSALITGESLKPVIKPSSSKYGGRQVLYRAIINMAAATTTTGSGSDTQAVTTSDNVLLCRIPAGYSFKCGWMTTDTSLGSAVVAIGTNKSHGSNGQFRAAATFTATDTPTPFGKASALAASHFTADTSVYLTCATANLPTSGTLVIDIEVARQ